MSLYAETSAVVAWLLGEPDGSAVGRDIGAGEQIFASELTLVEIDRTLVRLEAAGRLTAAAAAGMRGSLAQAAAAWQILALRPDILDRARRAFPTEPVRTLDAIHLASALAAREAVPGLAFLSLDQRCRANARALGFWVLPGSTSEVREEGELYEAAAASRAAERARPRSRGPKSAAKRRSPTRRAAPTRRRP